MRISIVMFSEGDLRKSTRFSISPGIKVLSTRKAMRLVWLGGDHSRVTVGQHPEDHESVPADVMEKLAVYTSMDATA